jgi:hypothetical protein
MWAHFRQTNQPPERGNIGRKSSPRTQYAQRTIWSAILTLPLYHNPCTAQIGIEALGFFGMVVNPVSIGHFTSLSSSQNGHVTPCGASFALLYGPETVNVFLHFMQVMIFSIRTSLRSYREAIWEPCSCEQRSASFAFPIRVAP